MKGMEKIVLGIIIGLIVFAILLIVFYHKGAFPFFQTADINLCKGKIIQACNEFKKFGDPSIFDGMKSCFSLFSDENTKCCLNPDECTNIGRVSACQNMCNQYL